MANTTDLVFKKIVNRQYTDSTKKWYEEEGAVPFKLKGSDVWIEPIPEVVAPNTPIEIVNRIKLYTHLTLTKDASVLNNKAWLVFDPDNTSVRMGNFISPRYGSGYSIKLYFNGDYGTEIGTTHSSSWFFDYEAGIVTFDNNPGATSVQITAYRYIGLTADDIAKFDSGLDNLIIAPGDLI